MTDTQLKQLAYAIEHNPVRYFVKGGILHWKVVNASGELCGVYFFRPSAETYCALLNAVYSFGYSVGQQSILNILRDDH